ncbi:hypothetical protein [Helicobacter pametensis]|uniref:hypothetical protein n=1 Tax=Helicobacter pametensis TaxID=95149 RepID=UPI000553C839|nr:hypothetical protein [Helicobacter pametensis]
MDLRSEKKQIYIDKEALAVLEMLQEGILSPVLSLMDKDQGEEVMKSGMFEGVSFPSPLIFSPNGKKNLEVITHLQKGEEVQLCLGSKRVGRLWVENIFKIDREERIRRIVGGDLGHQDCARVSQRVGEYGISGSFSVEGSGIIPQNKRRILEKIKELDAKRVCGVMLNVNPIHMVHEKILQEALLKHDLLVVFVPHHNEWFLPFSLRFKSLEYVINHFLPSHKIVIAPLEYTYLLSGSNRMILNALICKNYGCTDFIASLGSSDLSTFVEGDRTCTIIDSIQGVDLSIQLMSEYVYCKMCNTIKSTKICPHGKHQHISYDSKNFFEMLKLGLMPPEIFMRKEVSAMILTYLFPNQARRLNKLYSDLITHEGIVHDEEENFYEALSRLYHVK